MSIRPRHALLLLGLCVPLFFFRLGGRDLTSSHEARAAQHAQMMLVGGDWGIPTLFNNRIDLQKPPLYYWLAAFAGWLLGGVDAWAVRLPSALAALACVLTVFHLGRRLHGEPVGFLAALVLATSLHFTWLARVARIDMAFTAALTLAIAGQMLGRLDGLRWLLVSYLTLAAAVLLKGPLAIVLFAVWQVGHVVVTRLLRRDNFAPPLECSEAFQGDNRLFRTWLWGYALTAALALPWFLWANARTENMLWEVFVVHHNIARGLGGAETLASHPVWYYVPRLAIDLAPWSLLAPWVLWRARGDRRALLQCLPWFAWGAGFVAFFSLMRFKRADYLLPAYPGLALALAVLLSHRRQAMDAIDHAPRPSSAPTMDGRKLATAIALAVLAAWLCYLQWFDPEARRGWVHQRQAQGIRQRTRMPVIFFRTEAHALAFHVGRPQDTILEWENLDVWATRPEEIYIVMPADCAAAWERNLQRGTLIEVARLHEDPSRPLVLLRSQPAASQANATPR